MCWGEGGGGGQDCHSVVNHHTLSSRNTHFSPTFILHTLTTLDTITLEQLSSPCWLQEGLLQGAGGLPTGLRRLHWLTFGHRSRGHHLYSSGGSLQYTISLVRGSVCLFVSSYWPLKQVGWVVSADCGL